jgi:crotonobetainyl-CoA:carnitine CoA-transferase CaiB-like acyl-CoA transferase
MGDEMAGRSGGLLDGLRVIDLSLWQPGHTATQLLADLGAEVVKVEPPGGDRMRPQADRFANFNGGKRSVVLDLKNADDHARLLSLAAHAEVVVENFRPGVADRLGVGFRALTTVNPAVVLCSITGFGQSGPLSAVPGHDHNYQAYAGAFTFPTGQPPASSALLVGDQGSGMAAAFAIVSAVLCARRTGQGEHIDVAIADLLAVWVAPAGTLDPTMPSPSEATLPAMGPFRTADGTFVELGVYSENQLWDALCTALDLPDHVGLDMAARAANSAVLRAGLIRRIETRGRDELVESLSRHGVPIAPILTRAEMLDHPNFRDRGVITKSADGVRGVAHPIRYAIHPARPLGRAPLLNEHANFTFGPPKA